MKDKSAQIYVAGHRGMVGTALVRQIQYHGYTNITTRTSKELDLRRHADSSKPDETPRKLLDSSIIRELGWAPSTPLKTELINAYRHYLANL